MNPIINKIYIIHYKPLIERKQYITDFFKNNNITNYEFRSLYQREQLTQELKEKYFKLNNLNPLRSIRVFVAKWLQKCGFLYMFSVDKYIYRLIDIK